MSYCVKVTNLPQDFEEKDAAEMFDDIGPIKRLYIEYAQDSAATSSTAFIQFFSTRNARLAAINKDWMMFRGKEIRVRVIWCPRETLTTVKIINLPPKMSQNELMEYFASYGEILNIQIGQMQAEEKEKRKREESKRWTTTEMVALIAYTRVDYAVRVCQEMHHCVISNDMDGRGLSVTLLNGDARNLKWKKNRFEYVYCHFPIQKAKGLSAYHSCLSYKSKLQVNTKPQPSSDCSSVSSYDSVDTTSKCLASKASSKGSSSSGQCGSAASLLQLSPSRSERSAHSMASTNAVSCDALPIPELNLPPQSAATYLLPPPPPCNHVPLSYSNSLLQPSKTLTRNVQANVLLSHPVLLTASSCNGPFPPLMPPIQNSMLNQPCVVLSTISQNSAVCPISCTPSASLATSNTTTSLSAPRLQTIAKQPSSGHHSVLSALQLPQAQAPQDLGTNTCFNAKKATVLVDSVFSSTSSNSKNTLVGKSLSTDGKKSNSSLLLAWTAEQRKIGDIIYQELKPEFPEKVAKLTGMLLTLPKHELDQLVCDTKKLKARANQFVKLL